MADLLELALTDLTEDELWAHGLTLRDAFDLLDGEDFRTFPDPKRPPRRYLIGPDRAGRLLTLVIEAIDDQGTCHLITGWPSNAAETTLYSRSGGSQYAGKPPKPVVR